MRKRSEVQRSLAAPGSRLPAQTQAASPGQRGSGRICSGVLEARIRRLLSRASPGWGGSAPRACPQAPAGPAPQPGGSRLPVAPGPARRVPWATVSRETGPRPRHRHPVRSPPVRASAGSQCPPPCTPRPAPGFVWLGRLGARERGGWERRARSWGGPDPVREAEAAGRSRVVILWCGLFSSRCIPFMLGGPGIPGVPLPPLMG